MASVIQDIQAHDPVNKLMDLLKILQSHDMTVNPHTDDKLSDCAEEFIENLELALEEVTDLCEDVDLATSKYRRHKMNILDL